MLLGAGDRAGFTILCPEQRTPRQPCTPSSGAPETGSPLHCPLVVGGAHTLSLCFPLTAGSTKYFGTAKARYDFCAKDRSELSLKEGDIIRILSKKGQQGWWRGEIYGRVRRLGWAAGPGCGVGMVTCVTYFIY